MWERRPRGDTAFVGQSQTHFDEGVAPTYGFKAQGSLDAHDPKNRFIFF